MTYRAATPIADLTEEQLSAQVVDLARLTNWWVFHPFDSRRSAPGWPDYVLLREREVKLELKTERGRLSPHQITVIRLLLAAGSEIYIGRPSDLDDLASVLMARGRVFSGPAWDAHERLVERTRAEVGLDVERRA